MNNIDELLKKCNSADIQYIKLGELCSIITKQTGFDYSNHIKEKLIRERISGAVPYIQTKFFEGKRFDYDTDYYVPAEVVSKFPKITLDEKCLLFSIVGASIGNVGLFPNDQICFLGGAICVAKVLPQYNVEYLYYCAESNVVQKQIKKKTKGAGQATITIEDIREIKVPFPPKDIQESIVNTLNCYEEAKRILVTKLRMEADCRKKQYQYYLDTVIGNSSDNKVNLSELGTLTRGKRFVHADAVEAGIPCVHYGELYTYYGPVTSEVKSHIREDLRDKMRYASTEDLIIVAAGENKTDIGIGLVWEGKEKVAVHDACYILNHKQNARYLSYYLRTTDYHKQIRKYVSEGKICSISAEGIGKAIIPLPAINEQERIVDVIEKLDSKYSKLMKDILDEVDFLNKQYEYYRDMVLSFGKQEV